MARKARELTPGEWPRWSEDAGWLIDAIDHVVKTCEGCGGDLIAGPFRHVGSRREGYAEVCRDCDRRMFRYRIEPEPEEDFRPWNEGLMEMLREMNERSLVKIRTSTTRTEPKETS